VLRHRRFLALLVGAIVLVAATVGVLWLIPSNHYIVLPDKIRPVDPLVKVPGEDRGAQDGGIYMVDVRVGRASVFERIFPEVHEGASLVPERVLNPVGISDRQRRASSLEDMDRSQEIATTVALRSLGREVAITPFGAQVVLVVPDAPADGELQVGDVIVEADGERVRSSDELLQAMKDLRPGDEVTLDVRREGRVRPVMLRTRAAEDDPQRAVVGIQVRDDARFRFPVDVEINAGSIGGPSAGLAFALDIVDELGEEVDRGRKIVATGELTLSGQVEPIGGIEQKTVAAREAGADLFLVPDENAAEARKNADGLRVVAVETFNEALSELTN
jgi:PDZ domain-containing protein